MSKDNIIELEQTPIVAAQTQNERPLVQTKEIDFHGHHIQLLTEQGGIPFSETHIEAINEILEKFWSIDPQIVRGYLQFISQNREEISDHGFPLNGENGPLRNHKHTVGGAIYFTKRGMDTATAHRISSTNKVNAEGFVDNFSGTLVHELAHGTNPDRHERPAGFLYNDIIRNAFDQAWQKQFGWHHQLKDGRVQTWTTQPEKCIGGAKGYAATTWQEDIPDSVAACLLNSPILHAEKRNFINKTLSSPLTG